MPLPFKRRRKKPESLEAECKAVLVKFVTPTTVAAAMTLATAIITLAPILKFPLEVEKVIPLKPEQVEKVIQPET